MSILSSTPNFFIDSRLDNVLGANSISVYEGVA